MYLLDVQTAKILTILGTVLLIAIPLIIGYWIYSLGKKDSKKNQE